MAGYKITGKTCVESKREKNSKFKLPFEARHIDKQQYFNNTFINALKFHFFSHDLTVPYPIARKVLYDIWYDALKNSNDKIHKKNIELEYANYLVYFNEHLTQYHYYIRDWEAYRKSEMYRETLRTLNEIKRTDHRLQIATDFALSYLYAKYQTRHNYERVITKVEQALHLDIITKLWSKTSFWLAMQLLVFDPSNLYAATIANNKVYVSEFDKVTEEALKIYVTPWYEREDIKLSPEWRNLAMVYHELIVPLAGEFGSVALAEAARRGTVISLIHLANALTTLATLHPAMRTARTASKILEFAATFLDKSILAWLGWQIGVEWALDANIQKVLTEFGKFLYTAITGEPIKKGYYLDSELKEISEAVNLYLKLLNGEGYIDGSDIKLAEWYNNASLKLRFLFDKIIKTLEVKEQMYNQLKQAKITKSDIENVREKAFNYVCNPDANNFVKLINEVIHQFFDNAEKLDKYIKYNKDVEKNYDALSDVRIEGKEKLLSIPYLSLYTDNFVKSYENSSKQEFEFYDETSDQPYQKGAVATYFKFLVSSSFQSLEDILTYIEVVSGIYICYRSYALVHAVSKMTIEIHSSYHNSTRDERKSDFHNFITNCSNIDNMKSTFSQLPSDIHIYVDSSTPTEIPLIIKQDRLKLRKQKKCVSVIKKLRKVRKKRYPDQELSPLETASRSEIVNIEITHTVRDFFNNVDFWIGYKIYSEFTTEKEVFDNNTIRYRLKAFLQSYKNKPDTYPAVEYDCISNNAYIYPYLFPFDLKYDKSFYYIFNVHFVNKKENNKLKKSKRSKIVCFKQ